MTHAYKWKHIFWNNTTAVWVRLHACHEGIENDGQMQRTQLLQAEGDK